MEEVCGVKQLCAGTAAGIEGAIHSLNELFEENKHSGWGVLLIENGPKYGYYPEPSKSVLVVGEEFRSRAEEIFQGTGIKVVFSQRLLGGVIGDEKGKKDYIDSQVKEDLMCLTDIASTQPQAALIAFTKSIQTKWAYVQRVISDCQSMFSELEKLICEQFLLTILGSDVSQCERVLFSLPARWGGLGIRNPKETGDEEF